MISNCFFNFFFNLFAIVSTLSLSKVLAAFVGFHILIIPETSELFESKYYGIGLFVVLNCQWFLYIS